MKFDAIFTNNLRYTRSIHADVKAWVAMNIDQWVAKTPPWFHIERIPDEFLPEEVFDAEGGAARRRRSSATASLRELTGLKAPENARVKISPEQENDSDDGEIGDLNEYDLHFTEAQRHYKNTIQPMKEAWMLLANDIYSTRSANYKSNIVHVNRIVADNQEIFEPLFERCPNFIIILCHILEDKFGFSVRKVDWTSDMKNWREEHCRRVGSSVATFLRKRKTGEAAIE